MNEYLPLGNHLLIDLYSCKNTDFNKKDLVEWCKVSKMTPLKYISYKFKPTGKSAVILLSESHISIHTYPEWGYIALDIYTCGEYSQPYKAIEIIKEKFMPERIEIKDNYRGIK